MKDGNIAWQAISFVFLVVAIPFVVARFLVVSNQFEIGAFLSLGGLIIWLVLVGAGWRISEKHLVTVLKDSYGPLTFSRRGTFLYLPFNSSVVARIPAYELSNEFTIDSIEMRTPQPALIDQIQVRVKYEIFDHEKCYGRFANNLRFTYGAVTTGRLTPANPNWWKFNINRVVIGDVDSVLRETIWKWEDYLVENPNLSLATTRINFNGSEYSPHSLSLNRDNLSNIVKIETVLLLREWGVNIKALGLANFRYSVSTPKASEYVQDKDIKSSVVNFGDSAQTGDINTRDVVSGNVNTVNVNSPYVVVDSRFFETLNKSSEGGQENQRNQMGEQLGVYQRLLRVLELEMVQLGANCPPDIPLQINEIKRKISEIERGLGEEHI